MPTEITLERDVVSSPAQPENYRYGHFNGAIKPGVAYTGKIIRERLVVQEESEGIKCWTLDFLLDPLLEPYGEPIDVVEVYADTERMDQVAFHPAKYLNKRVRVVLGNCIQSDTWERFIITIELI